jgi:hypothetical protein
MYKLRLQKKVLLKTNASANKTALKLQAWHFVTFTTTKGDITAQLEYDPLPLPISLPLQKGRILVTDDKLKAKPFLMV